MSLSLAIDRLVAVLASPDEDLASLHAAQEAGRGVSAALDGALAAEIEGAAERLSEAIRPDRRGAQGAITLGVLIEHGASPAWIAPVLGSLKERLPGVGRFVGEVSTETALDDQAEDAHPNPFYVGGRAYDPQVVKAAADEEPEGGTLWLDLALWCLPCIAALTRDVDLRRVAQRDEALHAALDGLELEEGAGFLTQLVVHALGDEPLVVVYPELQRAFRLRAIDIVSTFQLHALLADVLVPVGVPGTALSEGAAACWRGRGAPSHSEPTSGSFQLWQWYGLTDEGTLPTGLEHRGAWIWNEGAPAEIERFAGVRTLLLSPPKIERTWNTGRTFGTLSSDLVLEEELPADEVATLVERLRAAAS